MADPYVTLGVAKTATAAEIKSAYRKLAKQLHPDRNKDNPKAAERFSDATKAYDLLSDEKQRAAFDRGEIDADGNPAMPFGFGGARGGGGAGGFGGFRGDPRGQGGFSAEFGGEGADISDLFEGLFGGGGARAGGGSPFGRQRSAPPPKGANVAYRLSISLMDAATRAPQRITLADGSTIDLKLPEAVESGTQMRLKGKGQPGPGGQGDGIVTIEVLPHPFFRRDGNDIRVDVPITLKEAVDGAKVRVPTVEGPVMVTVPAGATSGKTLRLKGRGWSGKGGARGDQLVTLRIDLPPNDEALRTFVGGWEDPRAVRADLGV